MTKIGLPYFRNITTVCFPYGCFCCGFAHPAQRHAEKSPKSIFGQARIAPGLSKMILISGRFPASAVPYSWQLSAGGKNTNAPSRLGCKHMPRNGGRVRVIFLHFVLGVYPLYMSALRSHIPPLFPLHPRIPTYPDIGPSEP